jgi:hypothetical protein
MKQRNPTWGCPRIAEQINLAFGTSLNEDVRRILALNYRPEPNSRGPSWLMFLGGDFQGHETCPPAWQPCAKNTSISIEAIQTVQKISIAALHYRMSGGEQANLEAVPGQDKNAARSRPSSQRM